MDETYPSQQSTLHFGAALWMGYITSVPIPFLTPPQLQTKKQRGTGGDTATGDLSPENEYHRNRVCCRRKLIRPELDNLRSNYPRTAEPFWETKKRPWLSLERS
jgi:hypothetical protein